MQLLGKTLEKARGNAVADKWSVTVNDLRLTVYRMKKLPLDRQYCARLSVGREPFVAVDYAANPQDLERELKIKLFPYLYGEGV